MRRPLLTVLELPLQKAPQSSAYELSTTGQGDIAQKIPQESIQWPSGQGRSDSWNEHIESALQSQEPSEKYLLHH
jgi:hypothetical protein